MRGLVTAVLSLLSPEQVPLVAAQISDQLTMEVNYLWSTPTWTVPFSHEGDAKPIFTQAKLEKLAAVAEAGFEKYLSDTLPKEMEADPAFAEKFKESDSSRFNTYWLLWLKRVFSRHQRITVDHLDWYGESVPKVQGVEYKWAEFYGSPEYGALKQAVEYVANAFLGDVQGRRERHRFLTWIWPEVYREGEYTPAHVHTGAYVGGMIAAKIGGGKADPVQEIEIGDTRGSTPPFGRPHVLKPVQGDLFMWPSWAPQVIKPQVANATNVYFSFLVWPEGGTQDLDWEDDPAGDYQYQRNSKINRAPKDAAPQKTEL